MARVKKEYNPNTVAKRKRRPIIYIICEGSETERIYFNHFRSRYCLVDIVSLASKYTAAEHLVKHTKSLLAQTEYYPEDGDQVWCVFDRDDNADTALKNAAEYAKKQGYHIAYSNPCFEYWYLLHFIKHNGYLNGSAEVIHMLRHKGRIEQYVKSKDFFSELLPHQSEAIVRAKERIEQLSKDGIVVLSRNSNPSTTVYELVEFLNNNRGIPQER